MAYRGPNDGRYHDLDAPVDEIRPRGRYTSHAGSSRDLVPAAAYDGGLPSAVRQSLDWRLRTDPDEEALIPGGASATRFEALVATRRNMLMPFRVMISPSAASDMAYVRWAREEAYVTSLGALDVEAVLQEHGNRCHRELLCLHAPLVHSRRESIPYATRSTEADPQWVMPLESRDFERKMRHKHGAFIPAHCREALVVKNEFVPSRYVSVPGWFRQHEEPYAGRTETPPIITYWGSLLMGDPRSPFWYVFRTEWAALRLCELIHRARDGKLFWMSPDVLEGIDDIGIENILVRCSESCVEDAKVLLTSLLDVRWGQVPAVNRTVPEFAGDVTPVYAGGDWVKWDPVAWKLDVPQEWLVTAEARANDVYAFNARGDPLIGDLREEAQMGAPEGNPRGVGARYGGGPSRYGGPGARGAAGRSTSYGGVVSNRDRRSASRAVESVMSTDARLRELFVLEGVQGQPSLDDVIRIVREVLETKHSAVGAGGSGAMDVEASGGADA